MLYGVLDRRSFLKTLKKSFLEPVSEEKKEDFKNQPTLGGKLHTIFDETELKKKKLSFELRTILVNEGYLKIEPKSVINYKNANKGPSAFTTYISHEITTKGEDLLNTSYVKLWRKDNPGIFDTIITTILISFILWISSWIWAHLGGGESVHKDSKVTTIITN